MASRRRPSKSSGPLDERQRKLIEEQAKLKERVEQLNRVIAEAPRIKAERTRAQRDELLNDRSTRAHRLNSTTLVDNRFEQLYGRSSSRGPRKPLKAERRQSRLIFLSLLVFLAILVIYLLSVWHGLWPG